MDSLYTESRFRLSTVIETPTEPAALARPLRADAARNRERVIRAARKAFAERGSEAQMEDVARRAGVGVGTVYRHFTTKQALIDAALVARFSEALAGCRGALQIDDPWEAVRAAFTVVATLNADDRCFSGLVAEQLHLSAAVAPVMVHLRAVWGELFARAQRVGAMRGDVGVEDLPALMCALASVVVRSESASVWQRHLSIMLDGLRAEGATPLAV